MSMTEIGEQAGKPLRDAHGRLLPGHSANPTGKSWKHKEILALVREGSVSAVKTLMAIHEDPEQPAAARVTAANAILDRAWGKARETKEIELNVASESRRFAVSQLTDEQLAALGAAIEALAPVEIIEGEAQEVGE